MEAATPQGDINGQLTVAERVRQDLTSLRPARDLSGNVARSAMFTFLGAITATMVALIFAPVIVWIPIMIIGAALMGAAFMIAGISFITMCCQEHSIRNLEERLANNETPAHIQPPQPSGELTPITTTET